MEHAHHVLTNELAAEALEEFAQRVSGSGDTGVLDGPAFLATLLEWVLGAYSEAFERLEERLEEFDVLRSVGSGEGAMLVTGYHEVTIDAALRPSVTASYVTG